MLFLLQGPDVYTENFVLEFRGKMRMKEQYKGENWRKSRP